ncbi:MAG: hypothetical protein QM727_03375 [Niabella sp.]
MPLPSRDSIKFSIENLFVLKEIFLVFYSWFDKAAQEGRLEMLAFDKNGARIGDIKLIDVLPGKNERKAGTFVVSNRPAENKFLSYGYKKIKGTSYINIDHIDYSGNKLQSQDFNIDNAGYVVHSFFDDENLYRLVRNKAGNRNVKWSLNLYSPNSNNVQTVYLTLPSEEKIYLSNMFKSYTDKKDNLFFLSSYTTTALAKKAEGAYLVKVDLKTKQVIKEAAIPFKIGAQNQAQDADFSLSSCVPVNIIPLQNGRIRILFESRLLTLTYGVPSSYNMGDIISVDIDSTYQQVNNINVIKKKQITNPAKAIYSGFAPLTYNDTTFCIYNELPQNLQRSADRLKNVSGAKMDETVVIYAATPDPETPKKILIERAEKSGTDAIMPRTLIKDKFKDGVIYILRKKDNGTILTKIIRG